MSTHTRILPQVVGQIQQADPNCGVVLFGSVAEGTERAGSDLDLVVISREDKGIQFADSAVIHEEEGMRLIRGHVEGITVDVACWPVDALARTLNRTPYLFYPISLGEILHDPNSLAGHCLQVMRDYFQENPAVIHVWVEQLKDFKRSRRDPSFRIEFSEWGDFVEHLGEMIEEGILSNKPADTSQTGDGAEFPPTLPIL